MIDTAEAGRQDRVATVLGWAIFLCFAGLFYNIITLPRTPLGERATLQLMHDSLGLIVGLLCLVRLGWFVRGPAPQPPTGMPAGAFAFSRAILFMLILTFAIEFGIGIFYAWGEGRQINFFGWQVPQLLPTSEGLRKPTGYSHSAFGFYYLMLLTLWLAIGVLHNLRYGAGWRRLFPGEQV